LRAQYYLGITRSSHGVSHTNSDTDGGLTARFIDYLILVIQLFTLIGLVIYVIKTWQIASATENAAEATKRSAELSNEVIREMRAARIQESAPQVIIYIDMTESNWALYLVVKNIGKSVARDVQFTFDPLLLCGFGNQSHECDIWFVNKGMRSLAPGQEIRVFLDVIQNYFGEMAEKLNPRLPTAYNVRVTYHGGLQTQPYVFDQVIDLSMFEGISHLEEQESKDTQALKSLADSAKRVQRNLQDLRETIIGGIPLRVPEILGPVPDSSLEAWKRRATAKLNELKMLWVNVYAGKFNRRIPLYMDNLQSRLSIIASQFLILASIAPTDLPAGVVESLSSIAAKLNELSERQFYIDGGESYRNFNDLGDALVKLTREAAEKIDALGNMMAEPTTTNDES